MRVIFTLFISLAYATPSFVDHSKAEIELNKIEDSGDLIHFHHKVYEDISSSYKGIEKSCMFTLPPEENKLFFGENGKYTRLKKYYQLQDSLDEIKKRFDPNSDPEYSSRKEEFHTQKQTIKEMFNAINERIPKNFLRNPKLKEILNDYKSFEIFVLKNDKNDTGWFMPGTPRHYDVNKELNSVLIEFEDRRRALHSSHEHFTSYAKASEYNIQEAKKEYRRKTLELASLKTDKYLAKWLNEIDEKELEQIFEKKKSYKRSKNLNIFFEGTGQYSPTYEKNLKTIQASLGMDASQSEIDKANKLANKVSTNKSYFNTQGSVDTWSGTIKGPIAKGLYRAPTNEDARNLRATQWLYLPSENISENGVQDLITQDDVRWMDRKESYSRGLSCLKKYLEKYPDANISLAGHSSGVKAALDFATKMKEAGISKRPKIIGIDPVIDMVPAALEGAADEAGRVLSNHSPDPFSTIRRCREIIVGEEKQDKGGIKSRFRDELKKPDNSPYVITYYQQQDTVGLGGAAEFAIHGSPVTGADNRLLVFENSNNQHHGAITQHEEVINSYRDIISK